ncbi:MAG TPA: hypothetical protein VIK13_04995 [Candidatus Limnocylindrales bacterium]
MPTPPERRRDHQVRGNPRSRKVHDEIVVTVFALLALLSIVSLVMTAEDKPGVRDPRDNPLLWGILGGR